MTQIEHVYAICCRPDVMSGENVMTIEGHAVLILRLLALAVSEKMKISHLRKA